MVLLVMVYGTGQGFLRAGVRRARARSWCRARSCRRPTRWTRSFRPIALRLAGPAVGGVLAGALRRRHCVRARRVLVALVRRGAAADAPVSALVVRDARPFALCSGISVRAGSSSAVSGRGSGPRSRAPPSPTCCFMGPVEVLLPYIVKEDARRAARPSCWGWCSRPAGSAPCSRRRSPWASAGCRGARITFVYAVWCLATLAVVGYGTRRLGLAAHGSQARAFNALKTAGTIVWATAEERHVPAGDARPGLEPRLADLDRPAAGLVRAHRPRVERDRRAGDTRRRGPRRRGRPGRAYSYRACATWRARPPRSGQPLVWRPNLRGARGRGLR